MSERCYRIVREFDRVPWPGENGGHLVIWRRTVRSGLTLEEARRHCADPETASDTATGGAARRISRRCGGARWRDTYTTMRGIR